MSLSNTLPTIRGLTILEAIGRGGYGSVYRARHHMLDVDVAVKVIDAAALDAGGLEKTLREARLMARLDHPNLLRVFDAGLINHTVYLVLELMDGGSCKGMRNLPAGQAMTVARQLLSGLQALHDARILHRDIKPANCLYRAGDGRVKLADLGIAADWATTSINYDWVGTIPFMAPELFRRPPKFSPSSDLYALGVTLACLLMTSAPFPSASYESLRDWVLHGERPQLARERPDVPPSLSGLIDRLMAVRSDDRPLNATEALTTLAAGEATSLLPSSAQSPDTWTPHSEYGSTRSVDDTKRRAVRIGPWELGEQVYLSRNWRGHVAHHFQTGKPARLMQLQANGPLAGESDAILAAAERASRLAHPHLIEVLDWGGCEERAYVITAMYGRTLQDLVEKGQPLCESVAIPFLASLLDAMAYLHEQGLVYQLLDPGATVVGSDATSAMLSWPVYCTPAGTPAMTPDGKSQQFLSRAFAAPEIVSHRADTIEPSVDLYGLGATFCYLLTGKDAYFQARKSGGLPNLRVDAPALTAPFARLVAELAHTDPKQRPSAPVARAELGTIAKRLGVSIAAEEHGDGSV